VHRSNGWLDVSSVISFSILSYNVSFFALYHCKISSEASSTVAMIRSTSSSVSVAFILGLLAHVFFLSKVFCRETFLFFDVLASVGGSFGGVTSTFSLLFSFFPSSFLIYFISSSSCGRVRPTFLRGVVLLISLYVLYLFLFLIFLHTALPDMLDPGDQGASNDVRVREFCIVNQYKELCQPFFGDLLHIFVG
jgi:hypothetical protein